MLLRLLLAVFLSAAFFFHYAQQRLNTPFDLAADTVFIIPKHTPLRVIAQNLEKENILKTPTLFLAWIALQGLQNQIKAGEYAITASMTPITLIEVFCTGKVIQHALSIVPGWTFERLRLALEQDPYLSHESQGLSDQALMETIGHPSVNPEARFFADTYYFPLGTSDLAFLKRAYDRMDQQLNSLWEKRPLHYPLSSKNELLILASIVEKESAFDHEYRDIAGVYLRRFMINMPLQADPSVLYGLGPDWKGPLTRAGIAKQTPYNTYKNKGLPPTPIAIPSQKALEATLDPKPGDALYFVVRPDRQGHVFSKNLEEHLRAVKAYRQSISKD
jgi:UPF0755 protein